MHVLRAQLSQLLLVTLTENPANRTDILDAQALPCLYDHCSASDSRIRGMAIWTLTALAENEEHRLRMADSGGLQRMLTVLRSSDVSMRRGAADCLVKLSKLQDIASSSFAKEIASQQTLSVLITALKDVDFEVNISICKTLQSLKSSKVQKLMLRLDGLAHLLAHAQRLLNMEGTTEIISNLTQTVNTLYVFMPVRYPKNVMVIHDMGYMGTILQLCKHSAYKVRRSAGKLLARLSTIDEAKDKMMGEVGTVNLLISMCKHRDNQCQLTAVKVIAELAEEPQNRVPLVRAATLPALFALMRKGDDVINFQCARAAADLAEAVDNRVAIVYGGLNEILTLMLSEDDSVQEQGMRCLVNLAGPAGFACGARPPQVGRFGGLQAVRVDDELDQDEDSSADNSSDETSSEDNFDCVEEEGGKFCSGVSDSINVNHASQEKEDQMGIIARLIDENLATDQQASIAEMTFSGGMMNSAAMKETPASAQDEKQPEPRLKVQRRDKAHDVLSIQKITDSAAGNSHGTCFTLLSGAHVRAYLPRAHLPRGSEISSPGACKTFSSQGHHGGTHSHGQCGA